MLNSPGGVRDVDDAWSWHPKSLLGQASATVGGSFCQLRRVDDRKTVRGREGAGATDRRDIRKESEKVSERSLHDDARKAEMKGSDGSKIKGDR